MDNLEKLKILLKENGTEHYYRDLLLTSKVLGLNDTFEFHCIQCGKCCKSNIDIMIFPYDIYRISGYLNLKPEDMVCKHCECYIGETSGLPVLCLKVRTYDSSCIFLRKGKCEIHSVKPTVCSLYPLGKIGEAAGEVHYILQEVHCGSREETHTVKEWLDMFSNIESEKYSKLWRAFLFDLESRCKYKNLYAKIDKSLMNKIHQTFMILMYFSYDVTLEFETQFNKNTTMFLDLLEDTWRFLNSGKIKR